MYLSLCLPIKQEIYLKRVFTIVYILMLPIRISLLFIYLINAKNNILRYIG